MEFVGLDGKGGWISFGPLNCGKRLFRGGMEVILVTCMVRMGGLSRLSHTYHSG